MVANVLRPTFGGIIHAGGESFENVYAVFYCRWQESGLFKLDWPWNQSVGISKEQCTKKFNFLIGLHAEVASRNIQFNTGLVRESE